MVEWTAVQARLGVPVDGNAGPVTYAALLSRVAGHRVSDPAASAIAKHGPAYAIDANPNRLSAFIGQCCHESTGFRDTREIWGPTALQRGYDTRADLGNSKPGDGFRYRGAGWIEVTGKYWFDRIGHTLGIDLVGNPDQASTPDIATLISLAWWQLNGMNVIADSGDVRAVSRKVNPGLLGLDERIAFTAAAHALLA